MDQQRDQSVFPIYKCYPVNKPFINDDLELDTSKPYIPFPESNRQAILSALKNLQKKIKQLENEKDEALITLHEMSLQTNLRKNDGTNLLPQDDMHLNKIVHQTATLHELSDLNLKLDSAEQRCRALNDQLNRLKQTYAQHFYQFQPEENNFDHDDNHNDGDVNFTSDDDIDTNLNRGSVAIDMQDNDYVRKAFETQRFKRNLNRARLLEEKNRLDYMKKITEDKVKMLEIQLRQERNRFRLIEEKAKKLLVSKPNQAIGVRQTHRMTYPHSLHHLPPRIDNHDHLHPDRHHHRYHQPSLQLQSTLIPSSHETGPNKQTRRTFTISQKESEPSKGEFNGYSYDRTRPIDSDDDINGLLFQLKEEYAHLQSQHDELQREVRNIIDPVLASDLEKEIDDIKFKMEIKQDQITRVQNLQEKKNFWKVEDGNLIENPHIGGDLNEEYMKHAQLNQNKGQIQTRSTSTSIPLTSSDGMVQILTTITTKGKANMS